MKSPCKAAFGKPPHAASPPTVQGPRQFARFAPADAIVAFANSHGMATRGHNLVWYNQLPGWLTSGNNTPAQLASILQDHINTVVGRYARQLYAWDVVNEAINDGEGDYGYFTPTREYYDGPYLCRDFYVQTWRHGAWHEHNGMACREDDGNWHFR